MTSQVAASVSIVYPESDGMPMADNTKQFHAIVTIQGNLDAIFRERADVFVAGDLLWYPVEGRPDIRRAPDVMVVFGRPKGDRGSYRQWEEDNIAPQVVFEVLSPNNTLTEMAAKLEFYDMYGVEEYYLYDPDTGDMSGWQRREGRLRVIPELDGWNSPRLGITFRRTPDGFRMYWPDGRPFLSFVELQAQAEQERQRAEQERQRAEQEQQRAEQERQRAEQERQRAERLAARLRELGINPDEV
ncbi:MAG: hypothetical protein KatS3mg055_2453 [Chloroflexus sp.]|uniref:Uma2 family endonuclease n=1 Tax=Chloroflexus sp. TaxID=1904827 RepID=UPI0021DE40E4|nr:Uma2 family endonuclease [Chloroflexus sp.]GIV89935.1 MAG: hypothetical protein KatS3mg055_2453 [Chloroflexus sp.]